MGVEAVSTLPTMRPTALDLKHVKDAGSGGLGLGAPVEGLGVVFTPRITRLSSHKMKVQDDTFRVSHVNSNPYLQQYSVS